MCGDATLVFGFEAAAIGALDAGRLNEAKSNRPSNRARSTHFAAGNQAASTSTDGVKLEQTPWRVGSATEAARRQDDTDVYGTLEAPLACARRSELARARHADALVASLLDKPVVPSRGVTSPNCHRDALQALVRRLACMPSS